MSASDSDTANDRTQEAIGLITSCCSGVGAFRGDLGEVGRYLKATASDMAASDPTDVFPDRYVQHVAFAVDMVASSLFLSPPAAVASVCLATRFEFYFRILSGKLNGDGTWISSEAQNAARAVINDDRLAKNRISSVALAYRIMKLDQSPSVVQYCNTLDEALYSTPAMVDGGKTVADIGDRIEFGRHAVGHGYWGDISSEALFYGLMTAVVFHNRA